MKGVICFYLLTCRLSSTWLPSLSNTESREMTKESGRKEEAEYQEFFIGLEIEGETPEY